MSKKNNIKKLIYIMIAGLITGIITELFIYIYKGIDNHVRNSDKITAEILVRQAEYQSEIKENHVRSKRNRTVSDHRYKEMLEKFSGLKSSISAIKASQAHILNSLDKIYKLILNNYEINQKIAENQEGL